MDRKPFFPKTLPNHFIGFQSLQTPHSKRDSKKEHHLWLPGPSGSTPSSPLCSLICQGLRGGGQSLTAPHFPPHPPCTLPFSFHSRVNSSPLRTKKKERTWPRCRKCSPVCQGEERREIKANKTSKSKIPKPPLGHPAAVKFNTDTRHRGESPSQIQPKQLRSLGFRDQAGLPFQGRDGGPQQARLFH